MEGVGSLPFSLTWKKSSFFLKLRHGFPLGHSCEASRQELTSDRYETWYWDGSFRTLKWSGNPRRILHCTQWKSRTPTSVKGKTGYKAACRQAQDAPKAITIPGLQMLSGDTAGNSFLHVVTLEEASFSYDTLLCEIPFDSVEIWFRCIKGSCM